MRRRAAVVLVLLVVLGAGALAADGADKGVTSGARSGEDAGAGQSGEGQSWPDGVDDLLEERGVAYRRSDSTSELGVCECAAGLLEERRVRRDCVIARAGYLDLLGRTWGCVLQGNGWVEVCLVTEAPDGRGSSVGVWRMDAADVARETGASASRLSSTS